MAQYYGGNPHLDPVLSTIAKPMLTFGGPPNPGRAGATSLSFGSESGGVAPILANWGFDTFGSPANGSNFTGNPHLDPVMEQIPAPATNLYSGDALLAPTAGRPVYTGNPHADQPGLRQTYTVQTDGKAGFLSEIKALTGNLLQGIGASDNGPQLVSFQPTQSGGISGTTVAIMAGAAALAYFALG